MTLEEKEELLAFEYFEGKKDIPFAVLEKAFDSMFGNKGSKILERFLNSQYVERTPDYYKNEYNHPRVYYAGGLSANDLCNISKIGDRYYKHLKNTERAEKYDFGTKGWLYNTRWLPLIVSILALIVSIFDCSTNYEKDKSAIQSAQTPKSKDSTNVASSRNLLKKEDSVQIGSNK